MLKDLRNFINGLAFGITQLVPGVSAATIAVVMGFYDELIGTINHFTENVKKSVRYLLPLLLGIAAGIILFSSVLDFLLTNYSLPTMMFFIGLLIGIVPLIYADAKGERRILKPAGIAMTILPMAALIAISGFRAESAVNPAEIISNIDVPYILFLFAAGVLSAAALVIPGISGAFVLLLLGIYPVVIYSISSIKGLLDNFLNAALILDICLVLAPFGIGVIIGFLSMARLIEKLIKNYREAVYSVILGLLLGSVFALFRDPIVYQNGITAASLAAGAATLVCGGALAFFVGKKYI